MKSERIEYYFTFRSFNDVVGFYVAFITNDPRIRDGLENILL